MCLHARHQLRLKVLKLWKSQALLPPRLELHFWRRAPLEHLVVLPPQLVLPTRHQALRAPAPPLYQRLLLPLLLALPALLLARQVIRAQRVMQAAYLQQQESQAPSQQNKQ